MFMRHRGMAAGATFALFCFSTSAFAQDNVTATAEGQPKGRDAAGYAAHDASVCSGCLLVPALTPVRIELLAPVGSKFSKSGDMFPIRLVDPILVDGQVAVPAGVTGMGEVVHAKKSGGSGSPGELIVAARYVDVRGSRLRLRSMRMSATGKSREGGVVALNAASVASPLPISFAGFLIKGKQVVFEAGTIADAKTAEDLMLAPAALPTEAPTSTQTDTVQNPGLSLQPGGN